MAIAAGGKIEQVVVHDKLGAHWKRNRTTVFNAQILNSEMYKEVTGQAPQTKLIDAWTYKNGRIAFLQAV